MVKAISLQDYYNRLEAFYDPDPMIRIAAIHHAGGKLDRNARLRQTLKDLLDDKDRLVARYAALRLAQSGDTSGLHHLVQAISRAQGQDREELDGCLRNCTRFPFAVVLNERLYLETIPAVKDEGYREVLKKALELTSDDFYEKSEQDTSFRDTFLKIMRSLDRVGGLRLRDGSVLDVGWVLSVPMGKQPGFLFCPDRRLFLKFQEESILNRGYVERGRQVLFVANETGSRSEADCLYVFEDMAPRQEQLKNLLTPEAMTGFARQSRLLPGVVAYKHELPDRVDLPGGVADKHELPDRVDVLRVDVLCANGKYFQESYRAQKASVSQFVLIEEETDMGRPQCHFVPGLQLHPTVIRRIVTDYADFNKMVLAQVTAIHDATHPKTGLSRCIVQTEKGEEVTTYIRAPRERSRILMKPCDVCQAAGEVVCDACQGRGENPCSGRFRCFKCNGTGQFDNGRKCLLCKQSGSVEGCKGQGVLACPVCGGQGSILCKKCSGSGQNRCGRCSGTGRFTCPVCSGGGRATCKVCKGSGVNLHGGPHSFCDGTGKVKCGYCSGAGWKKCGTCQGSGSLSCDLCGGARRKECFYCHGDAKITCTACGGAGKRSCGKCRKAKRVRCPYCQGNRLVFHSKVSCHYE